MEAKQKTSVFMTDSVIQEKGNGGGTVCWHIRKALNESTFLRYVVDRRTIGNVNNPFLIDYFANDEFNDVLDIKLDVAVSYGAPFGQTMGRLRHSGIDCDNEIVDIAPHNVEVSRDEHLRLGLGWNAPHLDDERLWKIYTKHIRYANTVVVHSRMGGQYLMMKCGIKDYVVIPHGCDIPDKIVPYPTTFTVGHLGVNGADKGQIYLYNAVANMNCSLLVAGGGTILGYIKDPSFVYDNCSVYVQPSVTEGFGIPVLEAMAHGRPVIVSEGAGASELITDGYDGFKVPIRDARAIRDKLDFFIKNPSDVERMGKNALETAKKYTWDFVEGEYKKLWA